MKKVFLFLTIISILVSCKKNDTETNEASNSIQTINFTKLPTDNSEYIVSPGPKYKTAMGNDIDPGPNYACYPSANLCFMIGPIYYRGVPSIGDDEVFIEFNNINGKLKLSFDMENITTKTKEKYFSNGYFEFNNSKYFPSEITKSLGLETPYLINKGKYSFTEKTSSILSIEL